MPTIDKIASLLRTKKSFLGHIHHSPDPDTIGSALALKLGLESLGKSVTVFCEDPLLESAQMLPESDKVATIPLPKALTKPHEVYLCLDTAKWELATHNHPVAVKTPLVVVDHHPDNSIKSGYRWVDPSASSTAQMVHELLTRLGLSPSKEIATCLLYGLLGDTGLFQNLNTKPSDFALAQQLMEAGADYHGLITAMARSYTRTDLMCMAKSLSHLKYAPDESFAWMALSYEDCKDYNGEPKMGFIANLYCNRIAGTEFGAILVEKEPGVTKGSLRSRSPEFDVAAIARHLGGGGHKGSASFRLEQPLAQTEAKFLEAVEYVKKG